jgi:hypothetical protein
MLSCLALATVVGVGCGGDAALGEECGESGVEEGECEEGAICGKATSNAEDLTCIKACTEHADCAANEQCLGVDGAANVKGCRVD